MEGTVDMGYGSVGEMAPGQDMCYMNVHPLRDPLRTRPARTSRSAAGGMVRLGVSVRGQAQPRAHF